MKNIAIFLFLNKAKAFNPKASAKDCFSLLLLIGQLGSTKLYRKSMMPTRDIKLAIIRLEAHKIYQKHSADKAHCS